MEIHQHNVDSPNVWHKNGGCILPCTLEKSFGAKETHFLSPLSLKFPTQITLFPNNSLVLTSCDSTFLYKWDVDSQILNGHSFLKWKSTFGL